MRRTSLVSTLAVLVTAVAVMADQSSAAIFRYRATGDWTLITDGGSPGWGPNPSGIGTGLPMGGDDARINFGGNTVSVTSNVPAVSRVQIGVDEPGTVVVENGGTLTSNGDTLAGNNNSNAKGDLVVNNGGTVSVGNILWSANGGSDGDITINSGGQVTVASHLWLGATGASTIDISGTLTQTGGILGLGTTNASTPSGGTATVNILDGGLLALNNIDAGGGSIQTGSSIDIVGSGLLTIENDQVGNINSEYLDDISGNGILGNVSVVFDSNNNRTIVSAIPEPATFLLLGLGLGSMLINRRR